MLFKCNRDILYWVWRRQDIEGNEEADKLDKKNPKQSLLILNWKFQMYQVRVVTIQITLTLQKAIDIRYINRK